MFVNACAYAEKIIQILQVSLYMDHGVFVKQGRTCTDSAQQLKLMSDLSPRAIYFVA